MQPKFHTFNSHGSVGRDSFKAAGRDSKVLPNVESHVNLIDDDSSDNLSAHASQRPITRSVSKVEERRKDS